MSDQNLVELRDLRKSFGDNVVLDGVNLSVARGEVIVIAGPSGSGKSTMLRCVNGLETPDSGEIHFDGRPVRPGKGLPAIRAEIGLVFQQFNLFPHMSVLDNITLAPVKVKGTPVAQARERAQQLLTRVGIAEKARSVPGGPVGRPAAAGGDRAGARHGPEADAVRRADVGAGPGDDPRGAGRHARPGA